MTQFGQVLRQPFAAKNSSKKVSSGGRVHAIVHHYAVRKFLKPITPLSQSLIEYLKLAASKMLGAGRRAFLAEMALKYYRGNPGLTEIALGWGRDSIKLGLAEKRSGLVCIGGQAAWSGNKRWEKKHPDVAQALWLLAESHAQQDRGEKMSLYSNLCPRQIALCPDRKARTHG